MTLNFMEFGLPEGAYITVHSGPNFDKDSIVEDGRLDSKCMVPWGTMTTDGAMLIMLHFEEQNATARCDKECIDTMGMFVLLMCC